MTGWRLLLNCVAYAYGLPVAPIKKSDGKTPNRSARMAVTYLAHVKLGLPCHTIAAGLELRVNDINTLLTDATAHEWSDSAWATDMWLAWDQYQTGERPAVMDRRYVEADPEAQHQMLQTCRASELLLAAIERALSTASK